MVFVVRVLVVFTRMESLWTPVMSQRRRAVCAQQHPGGTKQTERHLRGAILPAYSGTITKFISTSHSSLDFLSHSSNPLLPSSSQRAPSPSKAIQVAHCRIIPQPLRHAGWVGLIVLSGFTLSTEVKAAKVKLATWTSQKGYLDKSTLSQGFFFEGVPFDFTYLVFL